MVRFRLAQACFSILVLTTACGGGGGGGGGPTSGGPGPGGEDLDPDLIPDLGPSTFAVEPPFGTPADGASSVVIELNLISLTGHPVGNAVVELEISGCGNVWEPLPPTDVEGRTQGTLASFAGERKSILARTHSGGRLTEFPLRTAEFLLIPEHAYFVRTTGSDANSGRTPLEAWATPQHALASVEPGATIHLGAGSYSGPLELTSDSSATGPFVLAGDRDGSWTGDAGTVLVTAGGATHVLSVADSSQVVIAGLTLSGAEAGLVVRSSSDVRVLGCFLQENNTGLDVAGTNDARIQDCRLSANLLAGARFESAGGLCFVNNLVYANAGDGVELRAGVADAEIHYNTFYRNAAPHVREAEAGGAGVIDENILAEGGAIAVELLAASQYQSSVNLFWGNVVRGPSRGVPEGSLEANPLFADPFGPDGILGGAGSEDDDFRLEPGSPASDFGIHLAREIVLPSNESLATRTTRVDGELEGTGDDLAATNLGYHAALPAPDFHSLPKGGGRLAYGLPGNVRLQPTLWDRTTPTVTSADDTGPRLEADVVFLEERLSPLETSEELVIAQVNTGQSGRIVVRHWDGRRWDDAALSPYRDGIAQAELGDRRFDVEYETLSGRAVLVWADGDGIPSYRVLTRGSWGPELSVATIASGNGSVRVVELVPRLDSDELALLTVDDQNDLLVSLWNGTSWTEPLRLESNTLFRPGWRPFDGAFETQSGDLLVTWGFSRFSEETRWATLERATGTWRSGQSPATDAVGAQVLLAADPSSNRIAAVFGEGDLDNDTSVSVWTGTAWNNSAELTLAGPAQNRLLALTWFGDSGIACAVFRRQGLTGCFNIATLLPAGWRIQPDVVLSGAGGTIDKAAKVVLRSLPDRNHLLGMVLDQTGRLFAVRYDGSHFGVLNAGAPLATGLDPTAAGLPFDVALRHADRLAAFRK
jgi:hypothetical protein